MSARYLKYAAPRAAVDVGTPGKPASLYHPLTRGRFIYVIDVHRLLRLHHLARRRSTAVLASTHEAVRSAMRAACTRIA